MRGELTASVEGERVVELRTSPPLAAKIRRGAGGLELLLVTSAASLLEGDELAIEVHLGPRSQLTVRSVAATVAHPCPAGGLSTMSVRVEVGEAARLWWWPEPTVVSAAARFELDASVALAADAVVWWREELVLGRSGEPAEQAGLRTALRVDGPEGPLLRDGIDTLAPAAFGPAVLGRSTRYVGAVHCWGRCDAAPEHAVMGVDRFDLAGPGTVWRMVHHDPAAGRAVLAELAKPPG